MTLEQFLKMARGNYELTIYKHQTDGNICEDVEIPDEEYINYADYVCGWDACKNATVVEYRLAPNRNYDGVAIWVAIKTEEMNA